MEGKGEENENEGKRGKKKGVGKAEDSK